MDETFQLYDILRQHNVDIDPSQIQALPRRMVKFLIHITEDNLRNIRRDETHHVEQLQSRLSEALELNRDLQGTLNSLREDQLRTNRVKRAGMTTTLQDVKSVLLDKLHDSGLASNFEDEIMALRLHDQDLEKTVEDLRNENEALQRQLRDQDSRWASLRQEVFQSPNILASSSDEALSGPLSLLDELSRTKLENTKLRETLETLRIGGNPHESLQRLSQRRRQQELELDKFRSEIYDLKQAYELQGKELSTRIMELKECAHTLQLRENLIKHLKKQLEAKPDAANSAELSQMKLLIREYERTQSSTQRVKVEYNSLLDLYADLEARARRLEDDYKELDESKGRLHIDKQQAELELEKAVQCLQEGQTEIDQICYLYNNCLQDQLVLKQAAEDSKQSALQMERQLGGLQEEIDSLRHSGRILMEKNETVRNRLLRTEQEADDLRKKLRIMETQSGPGVVSEYEHQLRDLRQKLDSTLAELSAAHRLLEDRRSDGAHVKALERNLEGLREENAVLRKNHCVLLDQRDVEQGKLRNEIRALKTELSRSFKELDETRSRMATVERSFTEDSNVHREQALKLETALMDLNKVVKTQKDTITQQLRFIKKMQDENLRLRSEREAMDGLIRTLQQALERPRPDVSDISSIFNTYLNSPKRTDPNSMDMFPGESSPIPRNPSRFDTSHGSLGSEEPALSPDISQSTQALQKMRSKNAQVLESVTKTNTIEGLDTVLTEMRGGNDRSAGNLRLSDLEPDSSFSEKKTY